MNILRADNNLKIFMFKEYNKKIVKQNILDAYHF